MKKWFAAVLLAALVLTGCGPKQPEAHEAQLFAMDTLMSLRIWGDEALVTQTEDTLRSLEALLSATAEDSDIARLNRDGTAELQPQTADLLQQALDCAARTGGHNFAVELTVEGDKLTENVELLLDFKVLKRALKEELAALDHQIINEVPPFDRLNPSSENISRHIFQNVARRLAADESACHVRVHSVSVSEKGAQTATYLELDD